MKLGRDSSIAEVIAAVAHILRQQSITAVLTGGACASIYTGGRYVSKDVDFILNADVTARQLDNAMALMGFHRSGNQYVHPSTPFSVEFPKGPLTIGRDYLIRPHQLKIGRKPVVALSPTDSCRDRLAAFYFWGDRQSLEAAKEIGLRNRLNFSKIRKWSVEEGFADKYREFVDELNRSRRAK